MTRAIPRFFFLALLISNSALGVRAALRISAEGEFSRADSTKQNRNGAGKGDTLPDVNGSSFQAFPILSYDTDAGFGYGATGVLVNSLGMRESFDLIAFNTTRGERWYRFIFSLPDRELRQGKYYPMAVDLTFDYDKWMKYRCYGIGNRSSFAAEEIYTREPLNISLAFNRGISPTTVAQAGIRYRVFRNTNFSDGSRLAQLPPPANAGTVRAPSLFASYRHDSRDSFINPSSGNVLQGEVEYTNPGREEGGAFVRIAGCYQHYQPILPSTVLALRASLQTLLDDAALPVQLLLPIGGNQTLRGSVQDRYLDKVSALVNAEIRFPIVWRFGGIAGIDAGKVWSGIGRLDFPRWVWNPVAGIRFYWDRIIVRADFGFGKETTGFYLNFGQLF